MVNLQDVQFLIVSKLNLNQAVCDTEFMVLWVDVPVF